MSIFSVSLTSPILLWFSFSLSLFFSLTHTTIITTGFVDSFNTFTCTGLPCTWVWVCFTSTQSTLTIKNYPFLSSLPLLLSLFFSLYSSSVSLDYVTFSCIASAWFWFKLTTIKLTVLIKNINFLPLQTVHSITHTHCFIAFVHSGNSYASFVHYILPLVSKVMFHHFYLTNASVRHFLITDIIFFLLSGTQRCGHTFFLFFNLYQFLVSFTDRSV